MSTFKQEYSVTTEDYQNSLSWPDVRFRHMLFVKCLEEGQDPIIYGAGAWKKIGSKHYGWFLANDSLDVNAPPHIRHDFYVGEENAHPKLLASVFIECNTEDDTFLVYTYDEKEQKLKHVAEASTLEEVQSMIEVLSIMDGE